MWPRVGCRRRRAAAITTRHRLADPRIRGTVGVALTVLLTATSVACDPQAGPPGPTTTTSVSTTTTDITTTTDPATSPDPDHGAGGLPSNVPAGTEESTGPSSTTTTIPDPFFPQSVNLRQYTVPSGDQGLNGSCNAFALAHLMGWYAKKRGIAAAPDYAPMFVYSQIHYVDLEAKAKYPTINLRADGGSTMVDGLRVLMRQGIPPQTEYPQGGLDYTNQPTGTERVAAARLKATGFKVLFDQNSSAAVKEFALKFALSLGQPVAISMDIRQGFKSSLITPANPVYSDTTSALRGGHGLLAVGYDATGIQVQNSWGPRFGDNGFATLTWPVIDQDVSEGFTITGVTTTDTNPFVGGLSPSSMDAVSPGPNASAVYWVAGNGELWSRYFDAGAGQWSDRFPLIQVDGVVTPGREIFAQPDGTGAVEVLAQYSDGHFFRGTHEPGRGGQNRWSGIGSLPQDKTFPIGTRLATLSARVGETSLYAQGDDGKVWTQYRLAGQEDWSDWQPVGQVALPAGVSLTALSSSAGSTQLYALDRLGRLWSNFFFAGGTAWTDWSLVLTDTLVPPIVGSIPLDSLSARPGESSLYAIGGDGHVWTNFRLAGQTAWSGWQQLGPNAFPLGASIDAVTTGPGITGLYTMGFDRQVWSQYYDPATALGWSGWFPLGDGTLPIQPVNAFTTTVGGTSLHLIGPHGEDRTQYFSPGSTSWSGWFDLLS